MISALILQLCVPYEFVRLLSWKIHWGFVIYFTTINTYEISTQTQTHLAAAAAIFTACTSLSVYFGGRRQAIQGTYKTISNIFLDAQLQTR